jgi:hypothetical protein
MGNPSTKRLKGKAPVVDKNDRIYVGLDVHKHSVHAAVRINGELYGTAVLPALPKKVLAFLKPYQDGIRKVVYEAGPTGYGLVRVLLKAGIPTAIVAPSKIPRPAVQGAKSDQLDCRKLAEFAEKDLLREVAVPTVQEEEDRQLQRIRDGLVDRRRNPVCQHERNICLPAIRVEWGDGRMVPKCGDRRRQAGRAGTAGTRNAVPTPL